MQLHFFVVKKRKAEILKTKKNYKREVNQSRRSNLVLIIRSTLNVINSVGFQTYFRFESLRFQSQSVQVDVDAKSLRRRRG